MTEIILIDSFNKHFALTDKGFVRIYKCMNCGKRVCKMPMFLCCGKCSKEYEEYVEGKE